ncbi:MAG: hypothetical protein AAFR83_00170 [Cyanobacteria bacterium J06629_18]
MDNNESRSYNREVKQDSYINADGNTHTNITRTSETVENDSSSYQEGYAKGRIQERDYQRRNLARNSSNSAGSLLMGIVLIALATLVGGSMWYLNQFREAENTNPTSVETPVTTDEDISEPEENNTTTIIERTKEVVPVEVPVPVPQQQEPARQPQQRDININVQREESSSQSEPSAQQQATPNQPQSSNGSSNNSSSESQQETSSASSTDNSTNSSDSNSSNSGQ